VGVKRFFLATHPTCLSSQTGYRLVYFWALVESKTSAAMEGKERSVFDAGG
jgi:hypothetical protein